MSPPRASGVNACLGRGGGNSIVVSHIGARGTATSNGDTSHDVRPAWPIVRFPGPGGRDEDVAAGRLHIDAGAEPTLAAANARISFEHVVPTTVARPLTRTHRQDATLRSERSEGRIPTVARIDIDHDDAACRATRKPDVAVRAEPSPLADLLHVGRRIVHAVSAAPFGMWGNFEPGPRRSTFQPNRSA